MAGGKSVSLGKTESDLADGVGVRVSISRPLADVVTAKSGVSQISSVSVTISRVSTESRVSDVSSISGVSAVANGSVSRDQTVAIVDTGHDTGSISAVNLTD